MRVLPLGAYDAILGVDWLKKHGPIKGEWVLKTLRVTNMGKRVTLQGVQPTATATIKELPAGQLLKWKKGNDIWAMAVIQSDVDDSSAATPAAVQSSSAGSTGTIYRCFCRASTFASLSCLRPCHSS
jgi:hypothetical protein